MNPGRTGAESRKRVCSQEFRKIEIGKSEWFTDTHEVVINAGQCTAAFYMQPCLCIPYIGKFFLKKISWATPTTKSKHMKIF